jgi:hypothetical protein
MYAYIETPLYSNEFLKQVETLGIENIPVTIRTGNSIGIPLDVCLDFCMALKKNGKTKEERNYLWPCDTPFNAPPVTQKTFVTMTVKDWKYWLEKWINDCWENPRSHKYYFTRKIAILLLKHFQEKIPNFFNDIIIK